MALFAELTPLPEPIRSVPWPGPIATAVMHNAHVPGHSVLFLSETGGLVAGDMLSDVEIPLMDYAEPDPLGDYRSGLARLASLTGVTVVVPGHGHVGDAQEFRRRVDADLRYLDEVELGRTTTDPRLANAPDWMRQRHEAQWQYICDHS